MKYLQKAVDFFVLVNYFGFSQFTRGSMKAIFEDSIKEFEHGGVNFSLGHLESLFDSSKTRLLRYADLDKNKDEIKAAIQLVRLSLETLEATVECDFQKILGWQIELENTPQIEDVDDYELDKAEELKGMR